MQEKCKQCEGVEDFFCNNINSKHQCRTTLRDFGHGAGKMFFLIGVVFWEFCYGEGYFWIFITVEVLWPGNNEDVEVVNVMITSRMAWE